MTPRGRIALGIVVTTGGLLLGGMPLKVLGILVIVVAGMMMVAVGAADLD